MKEKAKHIMFFIIYTILLMMGIYIEIFILTGLLSRLVLGVILLGFSLLVVLELKTFLKS